MQKRSAVAAILVAVVLGGCTNRPSALGGIDYERKPGRISFYGQAVRVTAPDTAATGALFQVIVSTYGGGCTRKGSTDVVEGGLVATIRPYDYEPAPRQDVACPDMLVIHDHVAMLAFDEAGTATIRVHGWRMPENEPIIVERTIVIRSGI